MLRGELRAKKSWFERGDGECMMGFGGCIQGREW